MRKKQEVRSYNWELIIWQEHFETDQQDDINLELRIMISDNIHVPCILSPLHNLDKYTDGENRGEHKKPHWHLIMSFDNQKTKNQLLYLDKIFNKSETGNNLNFVMSRGGATRYLTHDGYEIPGYKFKYPNDDIQTFGGANYDKWFNEASGQKIEIIFKMIDTNDIKTFGELLSILNTEPRFNFLLEEASKKSYAINQYLTYKTMIVKDKKAKEDKENLKKIIK